MTSKEIFNKAEKKVVFIGLEKTIGELNNQKAVNIVGSGFIIKDTKGYKLVTAGHVLAQAKTMADVDKAKIFIGIYKTKTDNIAEYNTKTIDKGKFQIDDKNDLGVVCLDNNENCNDDNAYKLEKVQLEGNYEEGTKCISVGFPLVNEFLNIGVGITLFASSCMIASVKYNIQRKDIDYILTDSHVNPSSSGSPLISEDTGKVIGVVAGTFQNNYVDPVMADNKTMAGVQVPRNIGLIRPSYYLKDLLKNGVT